MTFWEFQWGDGGGHGGFVRLALHPKDRVAWYWAYLWRPGIGPVAVRDHEVALPRGRSLEIRAEALWSELVCETPGEHWSIGLEAFAVALDRPEDALTGEIGERIAFGLDLEWETTDDAAQRDAGAGRVRGEVLLGRETIAVDTPGPFTHSAAPAYEDRTIVAWDDGSWWWRDAAPDAVVEARSRALVPVGEGVVTKGLGVAALGDRRGTAWIESFAGTRGRIE